MLQYDSPNEHLTCEGKFTHSICFYYKYLLGLVLAILTAPIKLSLLG